MDLLVTRMTIGKWGMDETVIVDDFVKFFEQ